MIFRICPATPKIFNSSDGMRPSQSELVLALLARWGLPPEHRPAQPEVPAALPEGTSPTIANENN